MTPEMVQQMIISAFSALGFSGKSSSPWYFDSGASNHMTNNAQFLTNIKKYLGDLKIHTADGNPLPITATGDISPSLSLSLSLSLFLNTKRHTQTKSLSPFLPFTGIRISPTEAASSKSHFQNRNPNLHNACGSVPRISSFYNKLLPMRVERSEATISEEREGFVIF